MPDVFGCPVAGQGIVAEQGMAEGQCMATPPSADGFPPVIGARDVTRTNSLSFAVRRHADNW